MARPTSRPKSDVSLALTELREALGDSMQQFANRMGTAVTTIGRYETARPPTGTALRRFHAMAKRRGLTRVTEVFAEAIAKEKEHQRTRNRIAHILEPENIGLANRVLQQVWMSASLLPPGPVKQQICDGLLELADQIAIDGRKDLINYE